MWRLVLASVALVPLFPVAAAGPIELEIGIQALCDDGELNPDPFAQCGSMIKLCTDDCAWGLIVAEVGGDPDRIEQGARCLKGWLVRPDHVPGCNVDGAIWIRIGWLA